MASKTLSEASQEQEDTQEGKYLTFLLGKEVYGLEIRYVIEIIGIQRVTPVPDMPDYVKGVINLRGKVIPVMDARLRFSMAARTYDERTCIIVINAKGTTMGLIVDTVNEVLEIATENIEETRFNGAYGNQFMKGLGRVNKTVKVLLNAESLIFDGADKLAAEGVEP